MEVIKGSWLKHVKYLFRGDLKPKRVSKFIEYMIKSMGMSQTFKKIVLLPPGFDIFYGLKESHIALSYWGETGLCIMDVFSCKDFPSKLISSHIKKLLGAEKVIENIIMDEEMMNEVRRLDG